MKDHRPQIKFVATLALFGTIACLDDTTVGPRQGSSDLDPVFPDSGAWLGSGNTPIPVDNNQAFPDWQSTGIAIPSGVAILVSGIGKLHFSANLAFTDCSHLPIPPLPGGATDVGPAGFDDQTREYALRAGLGSASAPPSSALSWSPPLQGSADSIGAITGTGSAQVLWVSRPTVFTSGCFSEQTGYQPAYYVDGSQIVQATVLPPPIVVLDKTTIVSGDVVTGHPAASWTTNLFVSSSWQWVADPAPNGGSATFVSGCRLRDMTCTVAPHGDGHLEVPGVVLAGQLTELAASPTIHVAPAHITLVVDSSSIASGSQVKFTARRTDGVTPLAIQSWVWTPQPASPAGPSAVDCAGGDSVCATTLQNTTLPGSGTPQTGTMTAWAVLGTASESASVAVTVASRPDTTGCGSSPAIAGTGRRAVGTPVAKRGAVLAPSSMSSPSMTLSCGGGQNGMPAMTLTADHDTVTPLYPRIRANTVNGIAVPEREPDTAIVQIVLHGWDGSPVSSGVPVTLRAEWLPGTGGHAHYTAPIRFDQMARMPSGTPEAGMPLSGYFFTPPAQKSPSLTLNTDLNGKVETKVVAGYVGGRARVIASAVLPGFVGGIVLVQVLVDTVDLGYEVPGLVSLTDSITSGVYWIGGTTYHHQGDNFHVRGDLAAGLRAIADSLQTTENGSPLYPQYNDASLPDGGTFSVDEPVVFEHPFSGGHVSHDTGLDIDVGLCYSDAQGDGGDRQHRVSGTYDSRRSIPLQCRIPDSGRALSKDILDRVAQVYGGVNGVHPSDTTGTHYHIKFQ